MNPSSYESYSHEVSSWLHSGRKRLIQKVLLWHLEKSAKEIEILEVGAGVGQNIEVLNQFGIVDVMEIDHLGLKFLHKINSLRHIYEGGIPLRIRNKWNVILACDVIEHIEDDFSAIQWIYDHLKPGGIFLATVPAFNWLFSEHDKALGHYRRYTAESFNRLIPKNAEILSSSYFNSYLFPFALVSRFLWQLGRKITKSSIDELQKQATPNGKFINPILQYIFLKEIEKIQKETRRMYGLSYYVCFRKPYKL